MNRRSAIADRFAEIEKRVDSDDMLTAEQRAEIKERARVHVKKKQVERLTDQLFNEAVRIAEVEMAMPDEKMEEVTIDLPEYAYMIAIDNVSYYHGCTYEVPRRKFLSMIDQMARTWEHDREIHGRRRKGDMVRDPFHRGMNTARNTSFSLQTGAVNTRDSIEKIIETMNEQITNPDVLLRQMDKDAPAVFVRYSANVGANSQMMELSFGIPLDMTPRDLNRYVDKVAGVVQRQQKIGLLEATQRELARRKQELYNNTMNRAEYEAKQATDWEVRGKRGDWKPSGSERAQMNTFLVNDKAIREDHIPALEKQVRELEAEINEDV